MPGSYTPPQVAEGGAREVVYFGDGTGGTVELPAGVTADADAPPGCYSQGGRTYFFGAIYMNIVTGNWGIDGAFGDYAFLQAPAGFEPSALELGNNVFFVTLDDTASNWLFPCTYGVYNDDAHPEYDGLYLARLANTFDPPFPSTGVLRVAINALQWDNAGA